MAWLDWESREMDNPSRTDHYLMSLACEVRSPHLKKGASCKPEDFRLKFVKKGEKKAPAKLTKELATMYSKAKWCAIAGMERVKAG